MGTIEKNPNVDSAAGLLIQFPNIRPYPLYYPPLDKVLLSEMNHSENIFKYIFKKCVIFHKEIHICLQMGDMEKNGHALIMTKEEVELSTSYISRH